MDYNTKKDSFEEGNNYCGSCGLSLKPFDFLCQSTECTKCERRVYFQRRNADGSFQLEEGERTHISDIALTLDPMRNGIRNRLSRDGLNMLLSHAMTDGGYKTQDSFASYCKQREEKLDEELASTEYINHLNLANEKDVSKAFEILKSEGARDIEIKLHSSCFFGVIHRELAKGNYETASEASFRAGHLCGLRLLEDEHFKEIVWLGYQAYADIRQNEATTPEVAKEKLLVDRMQTKLESMSLAYLNSLSEPDEPLHSLLGVSGIRESALKGLLNAEIERRNSAQEKQMREREVSAKEADSKVKKWHLYVVIGSLIFTNVLTYFFK